MDVRSTIPRQRVTRRSGARKDVKMPNEIVEQTSPCGSLDGKSCGFGSMNCGQRAWLGCQLGCAGGSPRHTVEEDVRAVGSAARPRPTKAQVSRAFRSQRIPPFGPLWPNEEWVPDSPGRTWLTNTHRAPPAAGIEEDGFVGRLESSRVTRRSSDAPPRAT